MTGVPLRLGPLVFCGCLALYRAVWLSLQLSGFELSELGFLLLADLPVLGFLGWLVAAEGLLVGRWRWLPLLGIVGLVSIYVADVAAVVTLNARLQVDDLRRFAAEWWVFSGFMKPAPVAAVIVLFASFFFRRSVRPTALRAVAVAASCLVIVPFTGVREACPAHLHKYTGSVFLLASELWGRREPVVARYREADFAKYRDEYAELFNAPFARSGKDVVLLIVESLSTADSHRASGIRNLLPRFDELSREGMLFRNFFANFESSEGGIVALLSGVPPVHFPTASTDTFAEYSRQRSITQTYARSGYRCEFLTSVPIDFISMDRYARDPAVGFSHAAGQKEIARYRGRPKYAFESPTDHLLYEEVLARLDARDRLNPQPVLIAAITASSHPPFVDPLGGENTEQNAWQYVQEEVWWLHGELTKRGFFDNGVLLITGDHRKMFPVREPERERFGESAKARVPLVIIGAGVPRDVVDDRLFQQADLLRMLDRAIAGTGELSPFAIWAERYIFVFGVASNASNVQVFLPQDLGRRGYRVNVRGAEIEWTDRPPDAAAIERALHRQRASQQAERTARVNQPAMNFGRELEPARRSRGVLVGFSSDVDLSRDPDDPRGALKLFAADSFDLERARAVVGFWEGPYTLTARGFFEVSQSGPYWFSTFADRASCLAIDKEVVLGCQSGMNEGLALLTAGVHRFDLRFVRLGPKEALRVRWLPPGAIAFVDFPQEILLVPDLVSPPDSR